MRLTVAPMTYRSVKAFFTCHVSDPSANTFLLYFLPRGNALRICVSVTVSASKSMSHASAGVNRGEEEGRTGVWE